jgi:hypothetical protein
VVHRSESGARNRVPAVGLEDGPEGAGPRQLAKYDGGPGQGLVWRDRRYRLRHAVRKLVWWVEKDSGERPTWARTASCGFCIGSQVEIRCTCQGGAYPCNIETCGNRWACAVCAVKIAGRRAVEVSEGAEAWAAAGGTLGMLTLTARHHEWMALREVLGAVLGSWRKLRDRKEYRALQGLVGGTIKALEITVGDNGWHPHLHLLFFIEPGADRREVERLTAALFAPWRDLLAQSLGTRPSEAHGLDWLWMDATAADYVAKIGFEVTHADTKSGRDVFALLSDAAEGDAPAFFKCIEFFDTMKGRHSLDWSPGLRRRLGLGAAESDEELALADEGGEFSEFVRASVWDKALCTTDENGVPVVVEMLRGVEDKWRRGKVEI